MSLKDCIRASRAAGEITLEEAQALEKRYDQIARQVLSPASAKQQLAAELEAEAFEKKRRALLTESKRQELESNIFAHRNARGQQDPGEALMWLLQASGQARFKDVNNVRLAILSKAHAKADELLEEFRRGAFTGDLRRRRGDVAMRADNFVREMFGEGTGDEKAARMAKIATEINEDLRQRANAAGTAIQKLERYGLPQHHNGEAIMMFINKHGKEAFVERIMQGLAPEKMRHPLTGAAMTPDEVRASLRDSIVDNIMTDGWMNRDPSGQAFGKGAMFRRHSDHRFLVFKNADEWLRYQKDFGSGDPVASMYGHWGTMARDIAFMEKFGPNPDAMFTYLKQLVQKRAEIARPALGMIHERAGKLKELTTALMGAPSRMDDIASRIGAIHEEISSLRSKRAVGGPTKRGKKKIDDLVGELSRLNKEMSEAGPGDLGVEGAHIQDEIRKVLDDMDELQALPDIHARPLEYALGRMKRADQMWSHMRGAVNTPVNSRWGNALAGTRNIIGSAALGTAPIAALSDRATMHIARSMVGMPHVGTLKETLKQMPIAGPEARRAAIRSGLILDDALHAMHQQTRFLGAINTSRVTGYIADRAHAFSLLSPVTSAAKRAFGMEFQGFMADQTGKGWDKLGKPLREWMEKNGFTAAEWDQVRAAPLHEPKTGSGKLLRPSEIETAAGRDLAEKYLIMLFRLRDYAVIESSVRARSFMIGDNQAGTFMGELVRSGAMFKSFPVSFTMMHGARIGREFIGGNFGRGFKFALASGFMLGLFGALSLQLREIVQGRDPRDMTDPKFWMAAMATSGGLTIIGDFFYGSLNRFGSSFAGTLGGPLVDRASNLWNLTGGNVVQFAQGEKTNFGRELVSFARQNMPGSSHWYMRLALERLAFDMLQHLIDPEARAAFRRKEGRQKKLYGNEFWWAPGESSPRRAPDLSKMFGS
jgi:hypothetical protein